MARQLFTIGVHGTDEEAYFGALEKKGITHFVDVRRRRGMRGARHAYANANALMARLAQMGIAYSHRLDLAPSEQLRKFAKSHRISDGRLDAEFQSRFDQECLSVLDAHQFLDAFPPDARIVLFCVEQDARERHRSLVADHIERTTGRAWTDITP
jgi:uncharacterized protein (DUF488 family)